MDVRGKKVYVGLSGGVDSAVSAALLKQKGAQVHGVFIKGWYPEGLPCTWREDRLDAMRVAAKLQIPFETLDASEVYKKSVLDYLIFEYGKGRTPNPDIMCNRDVKFGVFYSWAKTRGADFIATGHYARVEKKKGDVALLRGVDEGKDQSYFLWAIRKEVLPSLLFPVGGLMKEEVRRLAHSFSLPVSDKKDSQGICFLGPVSIADFLQSEFNISGGVARDTKGEEIGTHDGALLYTIGERIALHDAPVGPWYVVSKSLETNEVVVSKNKREIIATTRVCLSQTNWFCEPTSKESLTAQSRYHGEIMTGRWLTRTCFMPDVAQPTLAEGQSLVVYRGEQCIGGGIIEKCEA